jgi:FlaA1/EpsC-like NDP-sugar epimerase
MNRRALQLLIDVGVLSLAFFLAYVLRYEGLPPPRARLGAFLQLPYVVLLQLVVLSLAGLHKTSWRYVSMADLPRVGVGLGIAMIVILALRLGLPERYQFGRVPLGVIAADTILAGVGLLAVRIIRRLQTEAQERKRFGQARRHPGKAKRVLLIGAGRAGAMVAKELAGRPDLGLEPVGFVDDDPAKKGTYIHGMKVLGDSRSLKYIVDENKVDQAIISIANAPGQVIRSIHEKCKAVPVAVKIIPGVFEILDGRVEISRMREVQIEDLLGRESVTLDEEAIAGYVEGKRVLVTGAGGSIGSELCRQIAKYAPAEIVFMEQAENALFEIDRELRGRWPEMRLVPVICDVCDSKRVREVFRRCRPEVVFHAAAHKHVPMMELNPGEAVKNNAFGTRKVADAAAEVGAAVMVLISTDKAVNPASIMGATKRVSELYIQAKARQKGCQTKYVAVRFGNVLGSAGSVVPIFEKQIVAGGPVTVTHPDMKRYFMTIPEACQLVMQAASMAQGGEIFVLDMGEPVKIVDLARDMIRLFGLTEGVDVKIEFTGIRPGEKLFEELAMDAEGVDKTRHEKNFIGKLEPYPWEQVEEIYARLAMVTEVGTLEAVRKVLSEVLPEFQLPASVSEEELELLMSRTPPLGHDAPNLGAGGAPGGRLGSSASIRSVTGSVTGAMRAVSPNGGERSVTGAMWAASPSGSQRSVTGAIKPVGVDGQGGGASANQAGMPSKPRSDSGSQDVSAPSSPMSPDLSEQVGPSPPTGDKTPS